MADNLIVLTTLRLTSDNIISKIQTATAEEKKEILQNPEFRKFIISESSRTDWGKVMISIDENSIDYLFDKDFANMFVKGCEEFNYRVDYLHAFLDKKLFRSLKDKDCFFILMQKPYFAEIYLSNTELSYEERNKLLKIALKETDLIGDESLSVFQRYFYPIKYDYKNIASYTENLQAIQDMQKLLSKPEIFKRYSENFLLISTLSPENREYMYKDADYAQMDENQRRILFKLIANNIQFRIPKKIYTNTEFIKSIAQLQDIAEYRNFINNLSDNNKGAMRLIETKRNEIYNEMIDQFIKNKLNKHGDLVYDKKTKKMYINQQFIVRFIDLTENILYLTNFLRLVRGMFFSRVE